MFRIKAPKLAHSKSITDFSKLRYPLFATPKLDGIRCLIGKGSYPLSRTFKSIPNRHIRSCIKMADLPVNLDGELVTVTEAGAINLYNDVQSSVMTALGNPDFRYYVFDYVKLHHMTPLKERLADLFMWYDELIEPPKFLKIVVPKTISNPKELEDYETEQLSMGFEGVMIADMNGVYKFGPARSTVKEQYLLKVKRFEDGEARIIDFTEGITHIGEADFDAFGMMKRDKKAENQMRAGTLGSLTVEDLVTGLTFSIGTGFNAATRNSIWQNRPKFRGKVIKYKHQPHGVKTLPRSPVFIGFRDLERGD